MKNKYKMLLIIVVLSILLLIFAYSIISQPRKKATFCFIFDDSLETDSKIVEIFENNDAKCGFALIGLVLQDERFSDYLEYNQKGFSMLCHSNNHNKMGLEEKYSENGLYFEMGKPLEEFRNNGIQMSGWVTPCSYLNPEYTDNLRKYYNYGYTIYFGDYNNYDAIPYDTVLTDKYTLKRIHISSNDIMYLKWVVDTTIENNGFLTFYGHSCELENEDQQLEYKLDWLLSYINEYQSKEKCFLLAPDEAVEYYFEE